jgi:NAD(P)-dependent dehydrogenase (short-subunit alcohol dehydrogenase family)
MFDLTGRVALVTGAGRGIGAVIAATLAKRGAAVIVNDLNREHAMASAGVIRDAGGRALESAFDVSNLSACRDSIASAEAKIGGVDILVNNAGGSPGGVFPKPFIETPHELWADYMDMNLEGVFNCTRVVVEGMVERGHGRLIEVSSDAGRVGHVGSSIYGAAKAGAEGFMRTLSKELGPKGVTANSVVLGLIDTVPREFLEGLDTTKLYWMRRIGNAEDVAAGVLYLVSDEAGWVNGHSLVINGGGTR